MTDQTGATVSFPWPGPECEGVDPMGRGRAKAKQTKVARDLKYSSPEMDLDRLQQEIGSTGSSQRVDDDYDDGVTVGLACFLLAWVGWGAGE